jgi:hyperosmotically inducible periplasmic protein
MKALRTWMSGVAVAGLALAALACENTAQGVKQDTKENTAAVKEEAKEAEAGTRDERAAAKDTAGEVASDVKDAAKEVGSVLDAGKQTVDVKAALMADASIDASNIDVDTDEATKTVHLKGTVPTPAQKTAAEKVARAKAEGYRVHNALTVAKKTS